MFKVDLTNEHPTELLPKAIEILEQVKEDFEDYLSIIEKENTKEKYLYKIYIQKISNAIKEVKGVEK